MAWCRYAEASGTTLTQILKEPISNLRVWMTYEATKATQAHDTRVAEQAQRQKWEYYAATIIAEIKRANQHVKFQTPEQLNMETELLEFTLKQEGDPATNTTPRDPYGGLTKEEYTARSKARWLAFTGAKEAPAAAPKTEQQGNGSDNGIREVGGTHNRRRYAVRKND